MPRFQTLAKAVTALEERLPPKPGEQEGPAEFRKMADAFENLPDDQHRIWTGVSSSGVEFIRAECRLIAARLREGQSFGLAIEVASLFTLLRIRTWRLMRMVEIGHPLTTEERANLRRMAPSFLCLIEGALPPSTEATS